MTDIAVGAPERSSRRRGLLPALGLVLLAPLFGEYLLGNLKFSDLALLPFLATLYGAGALLIRETARRLGRGSATMLLLGVAYALVEEGLVDQMLFNRNYFTGQSEGSDTYIDTLGVDAWLTLIVVAVHTIWSTYIPITIMESLVPGRRTTPWHGRTATVVTPAVFVGGSAWLCRTVYDETAFFASPAQLLGTSVVIAGLIVAALRVPGSAGRSTRAGSGPRLWLAVVFAFAVSSLYMLTEPLPGWTEVAASVALLLVFAVVVTRWARRSGFGERHRLALVAGGVLTYAWLGLAMEPETGPKSMLDHAGSAATAGFAIGLVLLAAHRLRTPAASRGLAQPPPTPTGES